MSSLMRGSKLESKIEWTSMKALQEEMVAVLEKADENINFEKFAAQPSQATSAAVVKNGKCCIIL